MSFFLSVLVFEVVQRSAKTTHLPKFSDSVAPTVLARGGS